MAAASAVAAPLHAQVAARMGLHAEMEWRVTFVSRRFEHTQIAFRAFLLVTSASLLAAYAAATYAAAPPSTMAWTLSSSDPGFMSGSMVTSW